MTAHKEIQRHGVFRITPVSPLHIGSGHVLTPFEYEIKNGKFIVKDILSFIDAQRDDPAYALQVIEDRESIGDEFTRYVLPCYDEGGTRPQQRPEAPRQQPQMGKPVKMTKELAAMQKKIKASTGQAPDFGRAASAPAKGSQPGKSEGEVREFIKDPFGNPYIPGSSLKGCMRTALAYTLVTQGALPQKLIADLTRSHDNKRERDLEAMDKALFRGFNDEGKQDVTTDVLRALIVRDSPLLDFARCGAMCFVRVMNDYQGKWEVKRGMPIRLEALLPHCTTINMPFTINTGTVADDLALQKAAGGKTASMLIKHGEFEKALRGFSARLLEHEAAFYKAYAQNAAEGLRFIQQLQQEQTQSNTIFLDLGFSTGWHAKTIGMALDERDKDSIRKCFDLGKRNVPRFPKTRKWAKTDKGYLPMGWIKLEVLWEKEGM